MKKLALLFLVAVSLVSCSLDDSNQPIYHYEILPVESFQVPDTFDFGAIYQVKLFFKYPTLCHSNGGIYFDRHLNERIFAIQSTVYDGQNCEPIDEEENELKELSVNFQVVNRETYLFKFYKGKDENGNNIFEEVEIPVNSD